MCSAGLGEAELPLGAGPASAQPPVPAEQGTGGSLYPAGHPCAQQDIPEPPGPCAQQGIPVALPPVPPLVPPGRGGCSGHHRAGSRRGHCIPVGRAGQGQRGDGHRAGLGQSGPPGLFLSPWASPVPLGCSCPPGLLLSPWAVPVPLGRSCPPGHRCRGQRGLTVLPMFLVAGCVLPLGTASTGLTGTPLQTFNPSLQPLTSPGHHIRVSSS